METERNQNSLKINQYYIVINGEASVIEREAKIDMDIGYTIEPFEFIGGDRQKKDGCVFHIPAGKRTRVVHVVEDIHIQEAAGSGKGWFLGIDPEGNVHEHEFDSACAESFMVEYGQGWTIVWVAGLESDMEVLNITEPKFRPEMEVEVPSFNGSVVPEFWNRLSLIYQEK